MTEDRGPRGSASRAAGSGAAAHGSGRPAPPATAGEMLGMAREFLGRKGLDEARLEAELLVGHALGMDRLGLFMQLDRPVTPQEVDLARDLLVRRGRREPVAYIIGRREFYGRDFCVGPGVLVPRPETELLVDIAREELGGEGGPSEPEVYDLGTGSGCIAVTLALELSGAQVVGADCSPTAIQQASANAERLQASVELLLGDGLELLASRGPLDLLVSNPPYVEPGERPTLAPEVRDHEPELALFAPEGDPDHWVRRLVEAAPAALRPGGLLLVELGARQGPRALELARGAGLEADLVEDLARIPRVLRARRR